MTDQTGEIRVLTDDGFAPEPFLDLRDRVVDLLDDAYSIPDDNPLVGTDEGLEEQYAWGFQQPWRMSFDSRGRLFTGDVGRSSFEEVDIVERNGNYGWNIKEGTHCFDPDAVRDPGEDCPDESPRGEPLLAPIVESPHERDSEPVGCAVIGGFVYGGSAIQDLVGTYVFGDVSRRYDEPAGRLFVAIPPDGDGGWTHRSIGIEGTDDDSLDGYPYTLGRESDGELYALTCSHLEPGRSRRGRVCRIVPSRRT